MKDHLTVIITSPDGERDWQNTSIAAPRVGDDVMIRDERGEVYIEGVVESVNWTYRMSGARTVVSVWLA